MDRIESITPDLPHLNSSVIDALQHISPGGVLRDLDLSNLSRWRIGGKADCIVRPSGIEQLSAVIRYLKGHSIPYVVVGATSNLLFSDKGLRVPCIQFGERFSRISVEGEVVTAEAGAWVPCLARRIMGAGLTGAEHICGIPGSLGGLICMNGGSQRKGIGDSLIDVVSVDMNGALVHRAAEDCAIEYRGTVFQGNNEVIALARLKFDRTERKNSVRQAMLRILTERRKKFPQKLPNCGSVFKSNPNMYDAIGSPGSVIERLGFKGRTVGAACVSAHHANFIVNEGGARAVDVLELINCMQETVFNVTGYRMEVEARYVSPRGQVAPADMSLLPHLSYEI